MLEKYKNEIKGALISSGVWVIVLNLVPAIRELELGVFKQTFIGIALIAIGVFWFK